MRRHFLLAEEYRRIGMIFRHDALRMVDPETALPGRRTVVSLVNHHYVNGHPIKPPFPAGLQTLVVGMGRFWNAERVFWDAAGVYSTAVGYAGGLTPNPTYREVCTAQTGHAMVVVVVFDPAETPLEGILKLFWENHDPTQGMRQGVDVGTQFRSAVYCTDEPQRIVAELSRATYQIALLEAGKGAITTHVAPLRRFFYAEERHQQYLAKNPEGSCGISRTGVTYPTQVGAGLDIPGLVPAAGG
jgi:peptide-methionine (S)-S-oxide reductase